MAGGGGPAPALLLHPVLFQISVVAFTLAWLLSTFYFLVVRAFKMRSIFLTVLLTVIGRVLELTHLVWMKLDTW